MDKYAGILERLEGAVEGGRELDAWIFCAVLHTDKKPQRNFLYTNREEWGVFVTNQPKPGLTFHDAPRYTTTWDAAFTLLLEGAEYSISTLYGIADVELPLNSSDVDSQHVRRLDCNAILAFVEACVRASQAIEDREGE